MADMEALFAEMRKAQTGGRDFAAEARAAAGASGDSDADSEDTGSEDDESATEHLPPRAMDASRTKACVRVSELGRATAREAKAVARSFKHGGVDADDPRVPDPALEAVRHRAVAGVAAVFESACGRTIGGRWWSHFEAWLYARRRAAQDRAAKARQRRREGSLHTDTDVSDDAAFDPVIPDPALARSDKALERKLEAAGMGRYEIVGVGMELSKACARARVADRRAFRQTQAGEDVGALRRLFRKGKRRRRVSDRTRDESHVDARKDEARGERRDVGETAGVTLETRGS